MISDSCITVQQIRGILSRGLISQSSFILASCFRRFPLSAWKIFKSLQTHTICIRDPHYISVISRSLGPLPLKRREIRDTPKIQTLSADSTGSFWQIDSVWNRQVHNYEILNLNIWICPICGNVNSRQCNFTISFQNYLYWNWKPICKESVRYLEDLLQNHQQNV